MHFFDRPIVMQELTMLGAWCLIVPGEGVIACPNRKVATRVAALLVEHGLEPIPACPDTIAGFGWDA